ncbi:hypothetical protein SAMN05216302_101572 [Nitrosomonas aestuarii]|uniref:Calx-beta domain-containing protein n=1 Tax=Nitrosomonas aestuarii TaxID=52441 RepID=A0A1I4CDY9_9PROT|nr:hypothetical protein [Nitrosomonas aestuarii]SFK79418.1 hypothetical protein SAMN05216302_101572 [Nitrosomonas aestuarii]
MDNQETQIHKIVAGLFGAASGSDLLAVMNDFVEANGTQAFAITLATFLPEATTEERTDALMSNFGFVADDDAESPGSLAEAYISGRLEAGADAGQIALNVVNFLSSESLATDFPAFVPWANLLANKAQLASIYSANFPSTTLEELSAPLNVAGIPTDSVLTATEARALLIAGGVALPPTFELAAEADSVEEGGVVTFTVTASEAVTEDTDVVFTVVAGDNAAADQGTGTTNLNDFVSGTFTSVTVTIPAGSTTATFTVTGKEDGLTELAESFSVEAVINGETLTVATDLVDSAASPITSLTTSADNFPGTSGADTFSGFVGPAAGATSTLTGADTVAGGAGIDIFNITNSSGAGVTNTNGALVNGIEIFNLRGSSAADIFTFDASATPGATDLNSFLSLGAVTVTNVPSGGSVGVIGNNSVTNAATTATYAAGATAQVLNIKDGTLGAGAIIVNGAAAADPTSLTINSTGAANTVGAIAANGTVTTTTINAATSLATGGLAIGTNAAAQSLVVSGAATSVAATATAAETSAVVLGALDTDFTSINASGLTAGGVSATLSATVAATFTGGAGKDMITTSTSGQTGAVDAAGGDNDVLTLADATHIDTTAEGAIYQGFEILSSAAAAIDMDLITGSTITGIWLGAAGSNVTDMNATQAANVTVIGALGATTLSIKDATMAGTLNTLGLTISDGDTTTSEALVAGGDLTLAGVETITINAIDDATFTTMANVSGMIDLTVSGPGDVSITTGAQALGVNGNIDFSGLTGTSTYDASAATTNAFAFTGGSNVDTVTDNVIGGSTISTGDGNDIITLTAKTGGTSGTTITGGAGADTVTNNVIGNDAADGLKFVYAAGDSVSDASTTGISATLTDTITGLDGATLGAAAGISAEFDTEVQATAVTVGSTDVVLGTTTVTNAGDFFVNIDSAAVTYIYQDTDGDRIIEAGEFAVALTGIATDTLLAADFTVVGGDLMLITT